MSIIEGTAFGTGTRSPAVPGAYTTPEVCRAADVTYRQLDYWIRTDLLVPSICRSTGSGSRRLFSEDDLRLVKLIKSILTTGLSLTVARSVMQNIRDEPLRDGDILLICTSATTSGTWGGHLKVEDQTIFRTLDPIEIAHFIQHSSVPVWVVKI